MVCDSNLDNDGEGVRLLQGVGITCEDLVLIGEIGESPVDYFSTRYRYGASSTWSRANWRATVTEELFKQLLLWFNSQV